METIKERLKEYVKMIREIDNQIERLERMELIMISPAAPNLTGMPKAHGNIGERIAIQVTRKIELEETIRKSIDIECKEREAIEHMIQQLKKPEERAIIRLRYFDQVGWLEICKILFGNAADFDENIDNYMRMTYKRHRAALINLENISTQHNRTPLHAHRN